MQEIINPDIQAFLIIQELINIMTSVRVLMDVLVCYTEYLQLG